VWGFCLGGGWVGGGEFSGKGKNYYIIKKKKKKKKKKTN